MKQELEAKTYIAREPCGCLVFACYNNPLTSKEVAQLNHDIETVNKILGEK